MYGCVWFMMPVLVRKKCGDALDYSDKVDRNDQVGELVFHGGLDYMTIFGSCDESQAPGEY